MTYLLDTNVVSEWVKPHPHPRVVAWLHDVDEEQVFLSVATLAEIRRGIELLPSGKRRDSLASWLTGDLPSRFEGRVLDIDGPIAESWGKVMAYSQKTGRHVGAMDAFFAATAVVHRLTLVTRNIRDFEGLGIGLLNPWESGAET